MGPSAAASRWLLLLAAVLLAVLGWISARLRVAPPSASASAQAAALALDARAASSSAAKAHSPRRVGVESAPRPGLSRQPGLPEVLPGPAGPVAGSARALSIPGGAELYVLGVATGPEGEALPEGSKLELFVSFTEQGCSVVLHGRCALAEAGRFEGRVRLGSGAGRAGAALEFQLHRPAPSAPWSARASLDDASLGGRYDVGLLRLADSPLLVSGRVIDPAGRGVPGVHVGALSPDAADSDGRDPTPFRGSGDPQRALHLAGPLERIRATVTDGAGRFAIFGEVARVDLLVVAGNGPAPVACFSAPGARDLELRLLGDSAVSGRVQVREGTAAFQLLRVALLPAESQAADPLGLRTYADLQPAHLQTPAELPDLGDEALGAGPHGCPPDLADAWRARFDGLMYTGLGDAGQLWLGGYSSDPGREVMQTLGPAQELRGFSFSLGLHAPRRYRLVWGGLRRVPRGAGLAWQCVERSIEFDLGAPDSEPVSERAFELE